MAIEFTCPECEGMLRVEDSAAGKQVRCGRCRSVLRVPGSQAEPPPEPPPEPPAKRPTATPVAPPKADDEPPLFEQGNPYPDDDRPARKERGNRDERDDRDEDREERERRRDSNDEDEAPRRRRRRPPPRGRSPWFWIAIIFGVLLFGTCTCCGGIYLALPDEKWQRHESVAGGFSVETPTPLQKDMPIPGMKPDPNLKVEGAILWKRGEVYLVSYLQVPAAGAREKTDEAILDELLRDMKSDPEIKRIVRNDKITVSGFPAREIEYVYQDDGTYVGRVILANRRMYILVGGGRFVRPGNPNVRRFLDSFKITDRQ